MKHKMYLMGEKKKVKLRKIISSCQEAFCLNVLESIGSDYVYRFNWERPSVKSVLDIRNRTSSLP